MHELSISFGQIVRELRITRQLSQVELADLCRLDRTFISMLERGIRQPSLKTLFEIAEALELQPADLVQRTSRRATASKRQKRVASPSRKL